MPARSASASGRRGSVRRAWTSSRRRASRRSSPSSARPASHAVSDRRSTPRPSRGARAGAAAAPGRRPRGTARRSKTWPRSYPRNPRARRRTGGPPRGAASRRAARRGGAPANGSDPAAGASRTATGSAVKYVHRAFRPGRALSSRQIPGRSPNFDDIDRSGGRDPRREAAGSDEGRRRRGRPDVVLGHRRMIRPSARRPAP